MERVVEPSLTWSYIGQESSCVNPNSMLCGTRYMALTAHTKLQSNTSTNVLPNTFLGRAIFKAGVAILIRLLLAIDPRHRETCLTLRWNIKALKISWGNLWLYQILKLGKKIELCTDTVGDISVWTRGHVSDKQKRMKDYLHEYVTNCVRYVVTICIH